MGQYGKYTIEILRGSVNGGALGTSSLNPFKTDTHPVQHCPCHRLLGLQRPRVFQRPYHRPSSLWNRFAYCQGIQEN